MNALFIVINEVDYVDEILEEFLDIGVKGATILDSQGMGSAIAQGDTSNIPLFGSLKRYLDSSRPYNKTIFTLIEDEELLEKAVRTVKEVVGDLDKLGVGIMFTIPIGKVYGM